MENRIRILWITLIISLCNLDRISCYYKKYDIEEICLMGNHTVFEIVSMSSVGTLAAKTPPSSLWRNCTIVIKPPAGYGVVLSIRELDLRPKLNNICRDYLKIFHSDVFESPTVLCRFIFDDHEKTSYFSDGPMSITYYTGGVTNNDVSEFGSRFRMTFTIVTTDVNDCKRDGKFFCANGRCISDEYICDTRNNCGDRSDESPIFCENTGYVFKFTDTIYISMVTIAMFFLVAMCFVLCVYRRHRRSSDPDVGEDAYGEPSSHSSRGSPYQAVHPSGFFICNNPAGPSTLYQHSKAIDSEGGFSNPCYPTGIPQDPPPYSQ